MKAKANAVRVAVDDAELVAKLKKLEAVAGVTTLRKALLRGSKPIRAEAQATAPVLTGKLKSKIRSVSKVARRYGVLCYVMVKVRYAHLVEFGTAPHFMGKQGGGKSVLGRKVHPGAAARPFLRPAFDTKKGEAVAETREALRAAVKKATGGA